jgi:hypothetical protein
MSLAADPAAAPSTPDWSTLADEIQCPLCDYNLRGLVEPRCPECGYQFDWIELLDAKRRVHPYLFEHHPERNLWSLCRTLIGGLRPTQFWQSLHPMQRSRPWRILRYAIICLLPLLLAFVTESALLFHNELLAWQSIYRQVAARGGSIPIPNKRQVAEAVIRTDLIRDSVAIFLVSCLLWPGLTMAGLFLFRWSMRRARVKQVHVIRCIVYSADLLLLLVPLYIVMLLSSGMSPIGFRVWIGSPFDRVCVPISFLVGLWFVYRLVQAYRLYLRFDHVVATVLASQVMAGLAMWKLVLVLQGF